MWNAAVKEYIHHGYTTSTAAVSSKNHDTFSILFILNYLRKVLIMIRNPLSSYGKLSLQPFCWNTCCDNVVVVVRVYQALIDFGRCHHDDDDDDDAIIAATTTTLTPRYKFQASTTGRIASS
jgi:hypothetical protein